MPPAEAPIVTYVVIDTHGRGEPIDVDSRILEDATVVERRARVTSKLYDRTVDEVTIDDREKIVI